MKTFKPFSLIGIFSIAFLVTFCFLFRTNAQEVYPKKEQTYTLSEGCPQDRLGEAAALWWDRNGMRSDNYIYYCFAGLSNDCKCGTKTNYIRFLPGVDYKQVGNSYPCSGSDLRGEYGPGRSVEVEATVKYTGKNYLIASWLDCWYNCTNVYSLGKIIFKTDNPYNPINDEATKAADNVSDTYIKITWDKGTHIPTGNHGYKIYRDGNTTPIYENDSESKFYFIDYNCNPGEEHTYEIKTWYEPTNKISSGVTAEGSTFKLNVNTISRDFDVLIQWTAANGIKDKDGNTAQAYSIKRYDPVTGIYEYIDDSPVVDMTQDNVSDTEGIPGFNYTYIVTPIISGGGGGFKPDSTLGMKKPDGIINGTIMAPFGGYVADVEVCAIRIDSVAQGDSGEAYCAITDLDGTYTIPEIYYYKGANFRIIPTKGNHGFKPAFRDVEFLPHSHDMQADFTDTSSFSITGRIIQTFAGDTCNVKGVEMHVNDLYRGNKSDGDGNFSLTVDEIGDYTIKPVFYEHGFAPADSSMYIEENQSGLMFEDTTRYTLEGYVRAPCEIYIGTADLWIFSRNYPSGCFDTIINTEEGTGYFSIELPAREYYFDLITFYPEDPLTLTAEMVEDYFNLQTIDLTEGDLKKNLIYRKPPKIQVSGFTEYGCEPYDVPIVRQGTSYTILIEVIEEFGEESCLTDTGYVVVYNSLVDGGIKLDTLQLSGGQALYGFRPGMPDIIPPHTKLLEIVAFIDDEMDQWSQEILVTGNHPREATFVTVSPEIPFMILRDPPGDASYSYLEEGTTSETAMRINRELGGSVNIYGEVKLGCAFSAGEGISFDYAFWGLIKGSLEVGGSVSDQSEYIMNITNVEQFSTSGNPNVTGEEGDVFAGASLNMLYALTDIIKYDPENCSVKNGRSYHGTPGIQYNIYVHRGSYP